VVTGAGGNVVVLAKPEGLLLVDSGSAERAADLVGLLGQKFGAAPIGVLFNTHWHLEHTGGNDAIAARGVKTIVAHENTRLWMSTKFYVEWEDKYYQRRAPASRPNKTFFTSDKQPFELTFGGERVVYGQLTEAHTDGDVYVHLPEHNVIVAGGAVTAARYPCSTTSRAAGSAHGGGDAELIGLADASTLIIPDVGPPQSAPTSKRRSRCCRRCASASKPSRCRAGRRGHDCRGYYEGVRRALQRRFCTVHHQCLSEHVVESTPGHRGIED